MNVLLAHYIYWVVYNYITKTFRQIINVSILLPEFQGRKMWMRSLTTASSNPGSIFVWHAATKETEVTWGNMSKESTWSQRHFRAHFVTECSNLNMIARLTMTKCTAWNCHSTKLNVWERCQIINFPKSNWWQIYFEFCANNVLTFDLIWSG